MTRSVLGTARPGAVYRFHELRLVKRDGERQAEDVEGGLFRLEGFVFDLVSRRDLAHFVGLDGADRGRGFVCGLAQFVNKFRPAEPEAPAAAPPEEVPAVPLREKPAGHHNAGGAGN